jgi:chemotaxis protein MotB
MTYKPKYLQSEPSGKERWLVSYTDFVTILMILFAAIAAQSFHATPARALETATASPTTSKILPQAQPPAHIDSRQALKDADQKLRHQGLDSHMEQRGLVITLPQAILFPSGEDRIMPAALPMLSQIAAVLASVPNKVALVGHADSVPIHNKRFRDNWELSAARGLTLLQLLATSYGIEESRLSVQSFGAYNPKGSNDTPEGRAENRRVEILLLDESAQ